MKIVHICLCDPYSENWSYHRNILSEQNAMDGHETYIIALPYVMNNSGNSGDEEIGEYKNRFGITVIRLKPGLQLPKSMQVKLGFVAELYHTLNIIRPDIIMMHNLQSISISDVIKYKKNNKVLLLGDTHASFANSCRSIFSRYFTQGLVYRSIIKKYYDYFDCFYYIGLDEKEFFSEVYKINTNKCNILPLPARFVDKAIKEINRIEVRRELGIPDESIPLFVHSGKLVKEKKTDVIIDSLEKCKGDYMLVIIGSIPKESEYLLNRFFENRHIRYLGWLSSDQLAKYISAADLYLQPGSPSVTMNNALAAGTPVMIQHNSTYELFYGGWEYIVNKPEDVYEVLQGIIIAPEQVRNKVDFAYSAAKKYFDCSIFAKEMYCLAENLEYKDSFVYKKRIRVVSR